MKYIDTDRLRAKIKNSLEFDERIQTNFYIGRRDAERNILALLDSLQQEQPEVDLEKEIDECAKSDLCPDDCSFYDFARIARHFYELGLNARKEE